MPQSELQKVRGAAAAMVFQDPQSSLHPFFTVGNQIAEAYRAHHKVSKDVAKKRAIEMLGLVGIPNPQRRVDEYPHEFSGGMRQRAMIAMALVNDPKLLIADEPTTALDVTVQAQILDLINDLQQEFGSAVILITHDLGVVAEIADDILVMYAGRVRRERRRQGRAGAAAAPVHLGSAGVASRASRRRAERLRPIQGLPPSLLNLPHRLLVPPAVRVHGPGAGRALHDRAAGLLPVDGAGPHTSRCHLPDKAPIYEAEVLRRDCREDESDEQTVARRTIRRAPGAEPARRCCELSDLQMHFPINEAPGLRPGQARCQGRRRRQLRPAPGRDASAWWASPAAASRRPAG